MHKTYPYIILLVIMPLQLWLVYFIVTYVRKRLENGPFWAKFVTICTVISQIPMFILNLINVLRCLL